MPSTDARRRAEAVAIARGRGGRAALRPGCNRALFPVLAGSPSCRCYHPAGRGVAGRQLPRPDGRYSALPATDEPVTEGTLTKAALVEQVADDANLTKKRAEVIVETVFGSVVEALRSGDKVEVRGFGSFRLRRRAPRQGRNPRTGDRVDVASKHVAYFKPGKELKELINRDLAQPVASKLSE